MRWQRYAWAATMIVIWIVSLLIVDSAARQTRMGYRHQELRVEQQDLEENNLRLHCEISVLHDLEKADQYAETHQMIHPDPETFLPVDQSIEE